MRLVNSEYISPEEQMIQELLNRYPGAMNLITRIINSYREMAQIGIDQLRERGEDTADIMRSMSKRDAATQRLGIPLFNSGNDWYQSWCQEERGNNSMRQPKQKESCQHAVVDITIAEVKFETYTFKDGKNIKKEGDTEPSFTGDVLVICPDCGFHNDYNIKEHYAEVPPEWLQRIQEYLKVIYHEEEEEEEEERI